MNTLIIFYSYSGNTKKVAELLKEALQGQNVILKNALTVKQEDILKSDTVVIGSPIHGYVLFGQNLCKEVRKVLEEVLPNDLERKKIVLFATYLFSPRNALKKNAKLVEEKNGEIIGLISEKRTNKALLVEKIIEVIG